MYLNTAFLMLILGLLIGKGFLRFTVFDSEPKKTKAKKKKKKFKIYKNLLNNKD